MKYLPKAFAKSLQDSVLPVPDGPYNAAPYLKCIAPVRVIQHLSVKGVITILVVEPKYS